MDLINGLHYLYPQIPGLGGTLSEVNLNSLLPSRPFSAMGWMPVGLYPFAVGMTYFIPLDLSFSIWFFYLFGKAVRIVGDIWERRRAGIPLPGRAGRGSLARHRNDRTLDKPSLFVGAVPPRLEIRASGRRRTAVAARGSARD